jgi:xylulokinase
MQSMLGSGLFEANQGVDVAGTCAMFCVSTKGIVPELSKKGLGLIFNSGTLPDTYFYWGFIRTGGLSLRWFKDSICQKSADPDYYKVLSEKASQVPAGCKGVLFLPYLTGGYGEMKDASGCFVNMTLDDDQFVQWRAVLEAIGYDYMEIADIYRAAGVDLTQLTVTEGGSRDSLWNQIKADMLGSRVVRYRNAGGAVVTNCVFAALASGAISEDGVRAALEKTIVRDALYEPNAENGALYRRLFNLKQQLVKQDMRKAFATLTSMRSA